MDNNATTSFSAVMSALRRERGLSQRHAAADMGISQALLSHYENGAREPGLSFVCRACDYYGVSADYILGRTDFSCGYAERCDEIRAISARLRALADATDGLLEEQGR